MNKCQEDDWDKMEHDYEKIKGMEAGTMMGNLSKWAREDSSLKRIFAEEHKKALLKEMANGMKRPWLFKSNGEPLGVVPGQPWMAEEQETPLEVVGQN